MNVEAVLSIHALGSAQRSVTRTRGESLAGHSARPSINSRRSVINIISTIETRRQISFVINLFRIAAARVCVARSSIVGSSAGHWH